MTYTISAQDRKWSHAVPLKKAEVTKHEAMRAAWAFSYAANLCDVVVTCKKKHVATYRNGDLTHYEGKEHRS